MNLRIPRVLTAMEMDYILSHKFQFRFWAKVSIGNPDECWPWIACLSSKGYGSVGIKNSDSTKMRMAGTHRIAWIIANRIAVPDRLDILHSCKATPSCCNPSHLRPGTHTENMREKIKQGRFVPSGLIGEKHPRAKLTDADVINIRELHATGNYFQRDLGEMFGVAHTMICLIVNRKNWKHI